MIILSTVRNPGLLDKPHQPTQQTTSSRNKANQQQYPSLGFIGDKNRVNVALSRAQRGVMIFGNAFLLSSTQLPSSNRKPGRRLSRKRLKNNNQYRHLINNNQFGWFSNTIYFQSLQQLYNWFEIIKGIVEYQSNSRNVMSTAGLIAALDKFAEKEGNFWRRLVILLLFHHNVIDADEHFNSRYGIENGVVCCNEFPL